MSYINGECNLVRGATLSLKQHHLNLPDGGLGRG